MTLKHLCILLLALVAINGVAAQSEDIPIENDNQFPPEKHSDMVSDDIEGSGDGTVEEPPPASVDTTPAPQLEELQPTNVVLQSAVITPEEDQSCPKLCVCHYEGGTDNFVVDCSGYDLTQFPSPIDPRATTLNLQNNKLTEIPKEVSSLKNLKVLIADNNQIMDLALGSISELPELTVLKLGNNRLIEYPRDLKNSLMLTKLEELDFGGNDMRGDLKPEIFSNIKTLRNLTLATSTSELLQDLCQSLPSIQFICTKSCSNNLHECDIAEPLDEGFLPAVHPYFPEGDNTDLAINSPSTEDPSISSGTEDTPQQPSVNSVTESEPQNIADSGNIRAFGGRMLIDTGEKKLNNAEETGPNDQKNKESLESHKQETHDADVTVGATTAEGKNGGGGVDKSVIGIVVAGMVVVIAGITIKKNWSSIKRKFSSSPRPAERAGANANGTTLPEEVPLQEKDKSPV